MSDQFLYPEVDTPALLLERDVLQANIDTLAAFFRSRTCRMRPHFKSHKCTRIAQLQMDAGAVGITCAKVGEAEVLQAAGLPDILIANQIVGPIKIARLLELSRHGKVRVAIDSLDNALMISAMAVAAGQVVGVLVEVDIGMGRCGVNPGQAAVDLVRGLAGLPGIRFDGLQGYEGHAVDLRDHTERIDKTRLALQLLVSTRRLLEAEGFPVKIVSGGGTGTYDINADYPGIDEVQAGSYATMDWWYGDIRPEFGQAMSILATVISRPKSEVVIVDVGRKGIGAEWGPPKVKNCPVAEVISYSSEEHMKIKLPESCTTAVGERLELIPSHGCTTSNLYREFVVVRAGKVLERWSIEGSGKLQ